MQETTDTRGEAIWIALVATAAVLGSLAFACATPFAALATVAATRMRIGAGLATVGLAWVANQVIGYGLHGYPIDANSLGWGLAIGVAAMAATLVARVAARLATPAAAGAASGAVACLAASTVAFLGYELVLFAATIPLHSGSGAFTAAILGRIAAINAIALLCLLALRRAASAIGLPLPVLPASA